MKQKREIPEKDRYLLLRNLKIREEQNIQNSKGL